MNSANLHQAVYTRLAGYVPLTSQIEDVYSRVPQPDDAGSDAPFPYVTFEIASATPFDTKTDLGINAIVQVHVWSRTTSDLVRRAIEDAAYDALHRYSLPITSASTVDVLFETKTEFADPDGMTMHGVLSFRVTYDEV